MSRSRFSHLLTVFLFALFVGPAILTGCADDSLTNVEIAPEAPEGSKFRHSHLLSRAVTSAAGKSGAADSVRLIIGFSNSTATAAGMEEKYVAKGFRIASRYGFKKALRGMDMTVPAAELDALLSEMEGDEEVGWIEPNVAVEPDHGSSVRLNSSDQTEPWGINEIQAHNTKYRSGDKEDREGSVDVDIYLLDTGGSHADLNVVECKGLTSGALAPCTSMADVNGHGTEVAGFAAAKDNRAGIVGVAPGAPVHVFKVLNEEGQVELANLIAVVDHLTERKLADPATPMVVNMSLGANVETTAYTGLDEAVRRSIATGVVYVVAAGNDGRDAATYSPAHVGEVITVGSYGEDETFSTFSNHGRLIDILAPGEHVEALSASGGITTASGTSHAAGWVSGAAALLLAKDPGLTPKQVRDRIVATARPEIETVSGTTNLGLYVDKYGM